MYERKPVEKIDDFLNFLALDGDWHNLEAVEEAVNLTTDKVKIIAEFFQRYGFIQYDGKKMRINPACGPPPETWRLNPNQRRR